MPYAPGVEYKGDQYLFQAISGLGKNIGDAIKTYRNDRKEAQFLDGAHEMLTGALAPHVKDGRVSPELIDRFSKFPSQSLSKKRGEISQMSFLVSELDKQRQEEDAVKERERNANTMASYLDIAKSKRGDEVEDRGRMDRYNQAIRASLQPTVQSVPTPIGNVPLPQPGRVTEQSAMKAAAESGMLTPQQTDKFLENRPRTQFQPSVVNVGGHDVLINSPSSAVPLDGKKKDDNAVRLEFLIGQRTRLIGQKASAMTNPKQLPEIDAQIADIDRMISEHVSGGGQSAVPPPSAAPDSGSVAVIAPDGRRGTIPAGKLTEAIKRGYKRAN